MGFHIQSGGVADTNLLGADPFVTCDVCGDRLCEGRHASVVKAKADDGRSRIVVACGAERCQGAALEQRDGSAPVVPLGDFLLGLVLDLNVSPQKIALVDGSDRPLSARELGDLLDHLAPRTPVGMTLLEAIRGGYIVDGHLADV